MLIYSSFKNSLTAYYISLVNALVGVGETHVSNPQRVDRLKRKNHFLLYFLLKYLIVSATSLIH